MTQKSHLRSQLGDLLGETISVQGTLVLEGRRNAG